MTSEPLYVWTWLPGLADPVVAGRLDAVGPELRFTYARSYRERPAAISLYGPELPLLAGQIPLPERLTMPGCIRDAAPDGWGRRVIDDQWPPDTPHGPEAECHYLLHSLSDRFGALDFQTSSEVYVPRGSGVRDLVQIQAAMDGIAAGLPLAEDVQAAAQRGTSLGGARPKAVIEHDGRSWLAKFSSSSDHYPVVASEALAMGLAAAAGIAVAPTQLIRIAGRPVLLVERFDRNNDPQGNWQRRHTVSALTLLGLSEQDARYASYEDLGHLLRGPLGRRGREDVRELYRRLLWNILVSNSDDHARNHAAFWDGEGVALTPAYDICPQPRHGGAASQAMAIIGDQRASVLSLCLQAAPTYLYTTAQARDCVAAMIDVIAERWLPMVEALAISPVDARLLWQRQFLNPGSWDEPHCDPGLRALLQQVRSDMERYI
ncbi:MAG: type II toxin-antitoxin system HipA family toxin [Planctomycetota bacterium]|nr:MAG: type II toxin-antitoxin system HipA family toxin [Planctomycetota bacterium]